MTEKREHQLLLLARRSLEMEGILAVESFDQKEIVLRSSMGGLRLSGDGLHIASLQLEDGHVRIEGRVDQLQYAGAGDEDFGQRGKKVFSWLTK